MLGLSRLYRYYVHDLPESKRIIQEQRAKIDPFAIVSIDEFIEKIMKPAMQENHPFADLFKKHAKRIEKTLFYWASLDQFESFNVKYEMMREEDQAFMQRRYTPDPSAQPTELSLLAEIKDLLAERGHIDPIEEDQSHLPENRNYPTLYFAHIVQAIEAVTKVKGILLDTEKKSIKAGHAQAALNFWRQVDNLKDYSTFFPHKPKPRGNNEDDGGSRTWLGGLLPGFGDGTKGWQPA